MKKIKATISFAFTDSKTAEEFLISLQPETLKTPTDRSNVSIMQEKNIIQLKINANDVTAFRATLNSYLIWIRVLNSLSTLVNT